MTKDDARHGRSHSKLQWHPAFVQAMQVELIDCREHLEFKYEYQLNAAPLHIDLLIIKKPKELTIDKNIGRIFRSDNLLEYKSPEDHFSIKDFFKMYAYANLYAAIDSGIDLSDLTLTFVGSKHPRTLFRYLTKTRGYTVQETSIGIYQVTGDYLPIQIIETKKLSEKENLWLKSLKDGLKINRAQAIFDEEKKKGREINLDAYMDVVIRANPRAFMEVETMAKKRRETFEEVFTEAGLIPEWMERGRVQGAEKTVRNLMKMSMPIEDIAQAVELPVEKVRSLAMAG